jgi:hypothetical protein
VTAHRTVLTTIAAATLAFGAIAVAAPMATAAPAAQPSTCTVQQRTELKATIADLKAKIAAQKLTPQERADLQSARKAAIANLKAQARVDAGTAKLTDLQKAELKAKIQALRETDKQKAAARHAAIAELKTQILTSKGTLQTCRA